jgi:hypothetical protein
MQWNVFSLGYQLGLCAAVHYQWWSTDEENELILCKLIGLMYVVISNSFHYRSNMAIHTTNSPKIGSWKLGSCFIGDFTIVIQFEIASHKLELWIFTQFSKFQFCLNINFIHLTNIPQSPPSLELVDNVEEGQH